MGWLQRLFGRAERSGGRERDLHGLYLFVRCNRCGEVVRVRVNTSNELSEQMADDDSDRVIGFAAEKGVVGNNFMCGQTMRVYLTFDRNRRMTEKRVEGGAFITEEEFQAASSSTAESTGS